MIRPKPSQLFSPYSKENPFDLFNLRRTLLVAIAHERFTEKTMPDAGRSSGISPVDLTFPAILFNPILYEREVLFLPTGLHEDEVDDQLTRSAHGLGVECPERCIAHDDEELSTAISTLTVSSEQRSSMSIRSHSTGLTSDPSRHSKDHTHLDASISTVKMSLERPSYDSIVESVRPRLAPSRASSTVSNPPPSRRTIFGIKRKRSHLPSIFRRDSAM
jgi:hypothetical protein